MGAVAHLAKMIDREHCARLADGFAVAAAVSLPWSTSATGIFLGLWLIVLIPTLDAALLRRVLMTPAGGLPVLLWVAAFAGMLWAVDVPILDRLNALKPFHKLLFIPLLMMHFRRSERGLWVMLGFGLSCLVMLPVSWAINLLPGVLPWPFVSRGGAGVLVKDYIAQSAEFTVCILLLLAIALRAWQEHRRLFAVGLVLLALVFLANILAVTTSRTALVVIPVLILVFAAKHLSLKTTLGLVAALAIVSAAAWMLESNLKQNVTNAMNEVRKFDSGGASTRAGERLEYWKKSIELVADAPLIGYGTGSIRDQFRRKAEGQSGMASLVTSNPHNQTFAVAIQLGFLGTTVLFAIWIAHVLLFSGAGFAAWAGLVITIQNIVGSLFNSHLFDFTHGWGYVIGVGVAAGVVFKNQPLSMAASSREARSP